MNSRQKYLSSCLLMIAALLYGPSPALASHGTFAVLAGTAVTCTNSAVNGDVGVSSGTVVTQTLCTITGTIHAGDTAAVAAYTHFLNNYAALLTVPACTDTTTLTSTPGNLTLGPGVYCAAAAVTFTDVTLTLTGAGPWIFKIGTGGTGALTGTNFSVVMADGGLACDVDWWVAQAATMTTSNFQGTILAGTAITITGGTFNGDALAGGTGTTTTPIGAVTLTGAIVAGCEAGPFTTPPRLRCNQGVGNGPEGCDPGNSNQGDPSRSNDELGGTPGNPGRKGGNK